MIAAALAVGCGNDDASTAGQSTSAPATSVRTEFVDELNAFCRAGWPHARRFNQQYDRLNASPDPTAARRKAAELLRAEVARQNRRIAEFRMLTPPAELRTARNRYISLGNETVRILRSLADALVRNDGDASADLIEEANNVGSRSSDVVRAFGAVECDVPARAP